MPPTLERKTLQWERLSEDQRRLVLNLLRLFGHLERQPEHADLCYEVRRTRTGQFEVFRVRREVV